MLASLLILISLTGCGGESSDNEDEDQVIEDEDQVIIEEPNVDTSTDVPEETFGSAGLTQEELDRAREFCPALAESRGENPISECTDNKILFPGTPCVFTDSDLDVENGRIINPN